MKKNLFRTFVLLGFAFIIGFSISCGKKGGDTSGGDSGNQGTDDGGNTGKTTYTITYELNGGTNPETAKTSYDGSANIVLPTPTRDGYSFAGWYDNAEFTGSAVTSIRKTDTGNKKFYAKWTASGEYKEKWDLNSIGFDGQGMDIVIKVLPVTEFDPFNAGYTGESQSIKQAHQTKVEAAYNVNIEYSAWDNEAPWGPERVNFIKNSYLDGSFQKKGVYIVNITSQWIPTLVKANCLASLYDSSNGTGAFANVTFGGELYEQSSTISEACSVNKKVYGYEYGTARPDFFMYYNATLAAEAGMEDPAELWFKGEWTWSTFDAWVKQAQTNLASDKYVIDMGYAPSIIGFAAAQGNKMINPNSGAILFTKSAVTSIVDKLQSYYQNGYWYPKHGVQDVSTNFVSGNTIFHDGSLWYLKESTRFDPDQITFEIGVVPYPTADSDNTMTAYTSAYSYYDTEGNKVKVTEPLTTRTGETLKDDSGNAIYGIDLSSSTYLSPYTGTGCYSIMDFQNGANGINTDVLFGILNDLIGGLGDDPSKVKQTNDEGYAMSLEKRFDSDIYVQVIMSVQDQALSYYELMETASMTVGNGSHFGAPEAWWVLASTIITGSGTAATQLKEVQSVYEEAVQQMGY